jgi:hypothetical protein
MRTDGSVGRMSDYNLDFYAWSQRQGALLRRLAAGERVNDADLDWRNIAEEIETLGRSERAALRSHILNVIEHLMKLHASPASQPRAGWQETIDHARLEIEELLNANPSARPWQGLSPTWYPRRAASPIERSCGMARHQVSRWQRSHTAKTRFFVTGSLMRLSD